MILIALVMFSGVAHAGSTECNFIWSTAVQTSNDAPDYIFCKNWGGAWKSQTVATYSMKIKEATDVRLDYQYDTTSTGSLKVNGITICSNTSSDSDINFLLSMDGGINFDSGTGTAAYYQLNDMTDAVRDSESLTVAGTNIKFSADGDTNDFCGVIRTVLIWD